MSPTFQERHHKLAIVISHPIQYHAPLYRHIAETGAFGLHVIYHNDRGARPYFDKGAQASIAYDNEILQGYPFTVLTRGNPSSIGQWLQQQFLRGLQKQIRRQGCNAVCFHGYNHPAHVRAMLRLGRYGIKVFLRGENEDVRPKSWWRNAARESLLRVLLKRLDAVLYIGTKNREFFVKRGFPPERMFFVPYSVDNDDFGINISEGERLHVRREICAEFGLKEDAVLFLHTCKHRAFKRPMDVITAFIKAYGQRSGEFNAALLMVGDGPLRPEMERRVREAGTPNVRFAGFVNQSRLKQCLWASDYCVNTASETWGCTFNEALPAGLGIISSDLVVGWHDLVQVGSNGFVFRCGCTDSLAHILTQCAKHPEWIRPFREVSKSIARVYSFDTCVIGLKQALDACAARRTCGWPRVVTA